MKQCTVEIHLTKEGHSVLRSEVTPAELLLLVAMHHTNSGGKVIPTNEKNELILAPGPDAVIDLGEDPKDKTKRLSRPRNASEEKGRLRMRYAGNIVESLFPGADPKMPDSFKSAYDQGLKSVIPSSKMTSVQ
jgi:hypothetical protein